MTPANSAVSIAVTGEDASNELGLARRNTKSACRTHRRDQDVFRRSAWYMINRAVSSCSPSHETRATSAWWALRSSGRSIFKEVESITRHDRIAPTAVARVLQNKSSSSCDKPSPVGSTAIVLIPSKPSPVNGLADALAFVGATPWRCASKRCAIVRQMCASTTGCDAATSWNRAAGSWARSESLTATTVLLICPSSSSSAVPIRLPRMYSM